MFAQFEADGCEAAVEFVAEALVDQGLARLGVVARQPALRQQPRDQAGGVRHAWVVLLGLLAVVRGAAGRR